MSPFSVNRRPGETAIYAEQEVRMARWIPRKMYQRFSALQTVAYNMRKNDGVKTRVKIGQCDFELSIRKQGSSYWKRCPLPADLPQIEASILSSPKNDSSPPPGRPGREHLAGNDTANKTDVDEEAI